VEANNEPPPGGDSLQFRYRDLQLVFRFTAPTFDEPGQLVFQYKVTGHQETWEATRFNEVELSSLDPGNYIFQLRARKYNSDWSKPQIVKFEVIAPFYGTLWFRLLVANTLIFLLYLFLRDYVGRKFKRQLAVYERQQVLEKERNRISKDMHDDLGADLTNIVILSKIARKTIKPQSHEQDAIDKIETAANDVINKMNEIIWALNPSNDSLFNLVTYLHRYAKEYMELYGIHVTVTLPAAIPKVMVSAAFRRNVFLVVKELLHNVAKHAQARSCTVVAGIDEKTRRLSVSIADDGRGFAVEERTGSGNGLLNVRKRMKEIHGDIAIESKPGHGTRVGLWAPYVRI
jgi:signal transduction histidine kinase